MLSTKYEMPFNILLPLRFFNKTISDGNKNSSFSTNKNILLMLLLNIMSKKPLNVLFKLSNTYDKLKKGKLRATIMS